MADCEPVFIPLVPPEFNFDPDIIEAEFKKGAKAILICNPSNPSGKVFTYDELRTIADLCIKYDVYAIMDEVYEHIIYEGHKHVYMNSLDGMWERTVSCSSLSKTYSVTGWRLGYAIAPKPLMDRIKQYHDFNAVGAASPLMEAACVGLNMPDSYYEEFGAHYAHMKKLFTEGLDRIGIPYTDPQGAYFVLADIAPFLKPGQSDVDFCLEMAQKVGVAWALTILFVFTSQKRTRPSMRLLKDFHTSRKKWAKNKVLGQLTLIIRYCLKRKPEIFRLSFSFFIQCGII